MLQIHVWEPTVPDIRAIYILDRDILLINDAAAKSWKFAVFLRTESDVCFL